jgi:hypothetical protein
MLHGQNPFSSILLRVLDIDQPDGKYQSGRFRDIYLNEDATKILLYTRNGGGNREAYQDVMDKLAKHPDYLKDYDDNFDCTYAYIEFSIPKKHKKFVKEFMTGEKPETVMEKFTKTINEMNKMSKEDLEKDPRFKPLIKIFEGLK